MFLAAPAPAAPGAAVPGSVPMSVLVLVVLGIGVWYVIKHKKTKPAPLFLGIAFGLAASGTMIGGMMSQMLGAVGGMIASIAGGV